MRICVVITARASFARCASLLAALEKAPGVYPTPVLHTSAVMSQYGDVTGQIPSLTLAHPRVIRNALAGGDNVAMVKTTGLAMLELATVFEEEQPDVVITIADRYETLAATAAAAYMNIPVAHLQGGERTGSIDDKVRDANSMLSDLHFAATRKAAKRLREMGVRGTVHLTGCPSIDLLVDVPDEDPPLPLDTGTGAVIDFAEPYLLICQHPVTTESVQAYYQMKETILAARETRLQAIWIHPNIDAGTDGASKAIRQFHEEHPEAPFRFYRNLPPRLFAQLMKRCACMVGNSSAALREGSFLGTPAVNIGSRQNKREHAANVVHAYHHHTEIERQIHAQCEHGRYPSTHLYGDGIAGERIAELLAEFHRQKPLRVARSAQGRLCAFEHGRQVPAFTPDSVAGEPVADPVAPGQRASSI